MSPSPRVSIIMPFLNVDASFFREAIKSVLAQTFSDWELLLVDDGSTNGSTEIAQQYAAQHPNRISYLNHADHRTLGASAGRNVGIDRSRGEYIALLDADDFWLPEKLAHQVPILDSQPEAGMLYANTLFWHSWTGRPEDIQRDYLPDLGIPVDRLVAPPVLLGLYLRGKAAVPCTCSVLMRRDAVAQVQGFEESFRDLYTDQAFYAKMVLVHRVFVAAGCLDRYRQHPDSCCAVAERSGRHQSRRRGYLRWLEDYLAARGMEGTEVWRALQREIWFMRHPRVATGVSASSQAAKRFRRASRRLVERWLPGSAYR